MQTLYLAGGINGLSDAACKDWRKQITDALKGYYNILDPMARDYRGAEDANVEAIVDGDTRDISRSHKIVAMCNTPSWGTAMEIRLAWDRRIPVIGICEQARVSPWLRYHCAAIVKTVDDAIRYLQVNVLAGVYYPSC